MDRSSKIMTFAAPEFSEFTGEVATFGSGTAKNEYHLVSVKIHLHVHYLISKIPFVPINCL